MIKFKDVSKIYVNNNKAVLGLRNINLELDDTGFVAICGESGAGKSTFLKLLAKIESPTEGEIIIDGKNTSEYDIDEMNDYRFQNIAFIYQDYNLIESLKVIDNVIIPLLIRNYSYKEAELKAQDAIKRVGIEKLANKKCSELSGGEKQRCAIARALVTNSRIIATDEPTANLDSKTAKEIISLLASLSKDRLVVIVTHNFDEIKDYANRRIIFKNNEIIFDENLIRNENNSKKSLNYIMISLKKLIVMSLINSFNSLSKAFMMILASILFIVLTIITFVAENVSLNQYKYVNNFANPIDNSIYVMANKDTPIDTKLLAKYDNYNIAPSEELISCSYNIAGIDRMNLYYMDERPNLIAGRYPENENEVCICLEERNTDYECQKYLNKVISNNNLENDFVIVGVSLGAKRSYLFGNDYLKTMAKLLSSSTKIIINFDNDFIEIQNSSDSTKVYEFNTIKCNTNTINKIIIPKSLEGYINSYDISFEIDGDKHYSNGNVFNIEYLGNEFILEVRSDYIFDNFYDVIIHDVDAEEEIYYWIDNGYFAVDMVHYLVDDNMFFNNAYIYLSIALTYVVLLIIILIFIFIFISLFNLRKKEYYVLMDLGLNKIKTKQLISLEFIWYILIGLFIVFITSIPIIDIIYNDLSIGSIIIKTIIIVSIFSLINCFILNHLLLRKKLK